MFSTVGDIMVNVGDILSTVEVFITMGDIMRTMGDILSTLWGCSVQWGDMISVEGIMSTVGDVQYRGGTQITTDDISLGPEHPCSAQKIPPQAEGKNQALVRAIPFCSEYLVLGLRINFDQPIKWIEFQCLVEVKWLTANL